MAKYLENNIVLNTTKSNGLLPVALSIGTPTKIANTANVKSTIDDAPPTNQWTFSGSVYANSVTFLQELYWLLVKESILQNEQSLTGQLTTAKAAEIQANATYQEGMDNSKKDLLQMGSDLSGAVIGGLTAIKTGYDNVGYNRQTIGEEALKTNNTDAIRTLETRPPGQPGGGNAELPVGAGISDGEHAAFLNKMRAEQFDGLASQAARGDGAIFQTMNPVQREEVIAQLRDNIKNHDQKILTISNNMQANSTSNNMISQSVQGLVKGGIDIGTAKVDADLAVQRMMEALFQALVQLSEQWSGTSNSQTSRYIGGADSVLQTEASLGQYLYKG